MTWETLQNLSERCFLDCLLNSGRAVWGAPARAHGLCDRDVARLQRALWGTVTDEPAATELIFLADLVGGTDWTGRAALAVNHRMTAGDLARLFDKLTAAHTDAALAEITEGAR